MKYFKKFILIIICIVSTIPTFGITSEEIIDFVKNSSGTNAFYYENIITGETFSHNENLVFKSASTIKLPLATYIYKLASEGSLDLDSFMTYTSTYYYEGTGIIQKQAVGTSYTLRDLTQKNIVYSDNIAYRMLRAKVGLSNFQQYLRDIGTTMVDTHSYNHINCIDYSKYIKDYYNFTLENPELGAELTYFWQNTDFNDHIPAGVPNLEVGHKIGWLPLENLYHDGGIVYDEQPYILIILHQGMGQAAQIQYFKTLTEKVHEYHETLVDLSEYVPNSSVFIHLVAQMFDTELLWDTNGTVTLLHPTHEIVFDIIGKVCTIDSIPYNNAFIFHEGFVQVSHNFIVENLTPLFN
ncbi:MAG: hypothetical protein ATN36_03985 [Epulopiscium sp. Nele67-Bin005]|nr:MAG: hypothetical protein ATN36_03985 [Epulopiscium sp. Nele67-Bin005]